MSELARNSHPETSHEAADAMSPEDIESLEKWAVKCVIESPGLTAAELEMKYGTTRDRCKITRRLRECARKGLLRDGEARKSKTSGKKALT